MISTQTVVLDTSVLAELMKPRPEWAVLRWTNAQAIGTLAVTAISLAELTYAMLRMSELARTIDLREALNEFVHDDLASRVLPFDDLAADYFAEFAWKREQAGAPIDVAEAQVAAICRAYGVTLATKDPAPYLELGVTAVDPWTAPPPVRVEVPVVVSSPELDRHGKPIPPRRPGAARGGVGPSRPPRQRRPRKTTAKGTSPARGTTPAKPSAAAEGSGSAAGNGVGAGSPQEAERVARARRDGTERMRRHVATQAARNAQEQARAEAAEAAAAAAAAAARRRAEAPREESPAPGAGPGRRGARLLGPLVDAEGRPVERTAEGKVRRRASAAKPPTAKARASGATAPTPAAPKAARRPGPADTTKRAAGPAAPAAPSKRAKDPVDPDDAAKRAAWPPTPEDPAKRPSAPFDQTRPTPQPPVGRAKRVARAAPADPKPKRTPDADR